MKRFVTLRDVHIRRGRPHRDAPARGVIFRGFPVDVEDAPVAGEVIDGVGTWYRDGDDFYWSGALRPVDDTAPPPAPTAAPPPAMPRFRDWRRALAGVPAAWLAHDGAGLTVAVVDSGIDHPDLPVAPDDARAFTPAGLPDRAGHGTAVAGLLAARGMGPTGIRGVAPGARLLSAHVYGRSGIETPALLTALRWCGERGADLVVLSHGTLRETDPALAALIAALTAEGVVFVAAAGTGKVVHHSGRDRLLDRIYSPARLPDCLAVGALSEGFRDAVTADPALTFFPTLDAVAPFVPLFTTAAGGGFAERTGSSFAVPVVAGLAALFLATSGLPRQGRRLDAVRQALLGIATDLPSLRFSTTPYPPLARVR